MYYFKAAVAIIYSHWNPATSFFNDSAMFTFFSTDSLIPVIWPASSEVYSAALDTPAALWFTALDTPSAASEISFAARRRFSATF